MNRALPLSLVLPSGKRAKLVARAGARLVPRDLTEAFAALSSGCVELDGGAIRELSLADANVLRVALAQANLVEEAERDALCDNCDEKLRVRPALAVELGPYLDGELSEEDEDELDHDADDPIPEVLLPDGVATTVRLRAVTVAGVAALHDALSKPGKLAMTPAVVRALGVVALGDETDLDVVASALEAASDEASEEIAELFTEAAYPERLTAFVRCTACEARTPVEAPALREFPAVFEPLDARPWPPGFPDVEAFEAHARDVFRDEVRERGVYGVALIVEHGTPDCDAAGNPLLGLYEPEVPEEDSVPGVPPTVRVFSRSFRREFADAPEVVLDEIEETIEHELDHHQAFLAGDDPTHDEEQAALVADTRREVGETETLRRASARTRGGLVDFLFRAWPLFVLITAVAVWQQCG